MPCRFKKIPGVNGTVLPNQLTGYTLVNGVGHFWETQTDTQLHLQGYNLINGVNNKGVP